MYLLHCQENEKVDSEDPTISNGEGMLSQLEKVYKELKSVTGVSDHLAMEKGFQELTHSTNGLKALCMETELKRESLREQNRKLKEAFMELRSIADAKLTEKVIDYCFFPLRKWP